MRRLRLASLICLAALSACASVRDQAVPGCPFCGDPVTRKRPDGSVEVVPRWRIATWTPAASEPAERR
jgi:hypothetical protein